jgi:hypothetical protein
VRNYSWFGGLLFRPQQTKDRHDSSNRNVDERVAPTFTAGAIIGITVEELRPLQA